jgi:hypothetical protein
MKRRPSTQDLTWLLDLNSNKQLDLDPPYQRRSVWTRRDKQYFLDTIFRDYPSPAIFLHKTVTESGKATYHVVDGKQRTQTILEFVADKLRISKDYGDNRLDGKAWSELQGNDDLKHAFWNYQITVEMLNVVEGTIVNEVFSRLNRNSRKLMPQELRHARFEGWLITTVEAEAKDVAWRDLGVTTAARAKRMADTQFLSEIVLVVLEQKVHGFDQDFLDDMYVAYDDPAETIPEFDADRFTAGLARIKEYLRAVESVDHAITTFARSVGNFYTLWCVVALTSPDDLPAPKTFSDRYRAFMELVVTPANQPQEDVDGGADAIAPPVGNQSAITYFANLRGASTELPQRMARFEALRQETIGV